MVEAMLGLAIEDGLIKTLSTQMSVAQILLTIGIGGLLAFQFLAWRSATRIWTSAFWQPAMLIRNIAELVGTLGFVTALALADLTTTSAILQAAPLIVTMGAALFLGERVGWRRWTAIVAGFLGVLMIIRPGTASFDPATVFAVQGVIGLAIRDVAIRRIPKSVPTLELSNYGFLMLLPAAALLLFLGQELTSPSTAFWGLMTVSIVVALVAYFLLVQATRVGDISFVTPFRYSRIVFALIIGVLAFGERPDLWTLFGAAVVIASGLYTLIREARLRAGSHI